MASRAARFSTFLHSAWSGSAAKGALASALSTHTGFCGTRWCAGASAAGRGLRHGGGVQIQNRGTIGGNVANASPAGDTFPPLAVYEASVVLVSARGRREVPLLDFFTGPKRSCLASGELVESLRVPLPARRPQRAIFRKVGTRAAQAISKTVVAGLLWLRRDGTVEELRFALGSMAPTVRRLRSAEAFVKGRHLTPAVVSEAAALVSRDVAPIDDVRSTAVPAGRLPQSLFRFLSEPR
jgi:CO/xanthine dehydrogenase FAD-binding subunit